jgi:long-chain acyl-CoA synthetase
MVEDASMNLARMLDEGIERFGTYDQLFYEGENRTLVMSNVEIRGKACALASGLKKLKLTQGEAVAVCVSNIPEVPEIINGIMRAGGVFLPVVFMLAPSEIRYILEDSRARILITEEKLADKIMEAVNGLKQPIEILTVGSTDEKNSRSYESLLDGRFASEPPVDTDADDLAMLMYTSGSTGFPKGVMLTHYNLESNLRQGAQVWPPTCEDRYIITVPMNHILGVLAYHETCFFRCSMVLLPRFNTLKVLELIRNFKITVAFFVPTMIAMMTERFDPQIHSMSSIKRMISAGAPLPEETLMTAMKRFGVTIYHGYGLTEAGPTVSRQRLDRPLKPGSVGPPVPGLELKLIDEQGNEVAQGEEGEIICRGTGIMKGYWNKPEATAEALKSGWLYTGDLGRLDEDGELYIVGRKKDLIIKGGENIDPGVSENLLLKHPAVLEAAVVGIPDPKYGEEVSAAVVLKNGKTVSETDLLAYMETHLHHFVAPKKILILNELPKTGIGKILKREIKTMFEI